MPEKFWQSVARHICMLFMLVFVIAACTADNEAQVSTSAAATTETSIAPATSIETTTSVSSTTEPSTTEPLTTGQAGQPVEVFFGVGDGTDCEEVETFARTVDDSVDLYLGTFAALVAGPTELETENGAGSFFSSQTADVIKSAILTDGLLRVDFSDIRALIPNASTSCGSQALLAQLNSTAFQFPGVERTRFLIEGSCGDFANWLQRECFETDRVGGQLDLPTIEQAGGAGCTPSSVDTLPAGRWFGYITEANAHELSFDLACWFTGGAAVSAAAEDGAESPPPNDYYVRNDSDRVRTHQVDSATEVRWLPELGNPETAEVVSYSSWLAGDGHLTESAGFWITVVDDSHVVAIEEQFVP